LKVACVFGTRPEIIKMAPIIWEARKRSQIELVTIHTGQHYDPSMSLNFIEEFGLEMPDHNLEVGSGSSAMQIAETIRKL
jgi:UDP-N-acetylglucosamine 2-epimerase (non-hydrolysing)